MATPNPCRNHSKILLSVKSELCDELLYSDTSLSFREATWSILALARTGVTIPAQ